MNALIFAAGLGARMRPLTDHVPKPLLDVGGKPLIAWHLEKLANLGTRNVVINTSWLAEQLPHALGDGSRWGLQLHFSHEGPTPLETGGGMLNALHLLGESPFIAVNGDIWTDYDFAKLPREPAGLAHLVLVDNPEHHPQGDFRLGTSGLLQSDGNDKLTFAGLGVYRPQLLNTWRDVIGDTDGAHETPPRFMLAPLLRAAMGQQQVHGEHHQGRWTDVGTPERLTLLRNELSEAHA